METGWKKWKEQEEKNKERIRICARRKTTCPICRTTRESNRHEKLQNLPYYLKNGGFDDEDVSGLSSAFVEDRGERASTTAIV